ncbi:ATPase [Burkholderia vietnamiensis]|uniref:ATPase n=1 Tax=Burkholderia vietnamiensis TaxID=60552 RepID=UPI001D153492|nr:ATPase [Burkholderia vietnamiensis]UEC02369.1 ATPase [Burkholderia vietnamiensis]
MLNELETLSQNIGRLISLNKRYHSERLALEEQVTQLSADADTVRAELAQLREERNALAAERDTLSAKIDDAQVKLNAILEKLPRTKSVEQADNQLDLLDGQARPDSDDAASHGEHA